MNNQTIDGVLVSRELLERVLGWLEFNKHYRVEDQAELRALLDEPIPFHGYPPVPEDRKLPAVQYREVDGEHCQNPECCAWIDPNSECTQCKPAAQPQGEPVDPAIERARKIESLRGAFEQRFKLDIWTVVDWLRNSGIYAEQLAPVAV